MKTYTLLLCCLFAAYSITFAQVPFQGLITTEVQPIKKAHLQDNIQILYHNSYNGNLKVYVNDELVFDKLVLKGTVDSLTLGGNIARSPQAIMRIVLDDLFYLEQVVNFHHAFIRINYAKEDRQLVLYYEDKLPNAEELQRDVLKEQITMAIQRRLAEGGR